MLRLADWSYIQQISLSGKVKSDALDFLIANDKQPVAEHCIAVSRISEDLAFRFGLDKTIVASAAHLHDVSNVLNPQDMLDYAINCGWLLDEAEKKYPFLLHQRISAVFAKDVFGVKNDRILSAIECHTTLKSNPSEYDMLLFLADKLSWVENGTAPFAAVVSLALEHSLTAACQAYIHFILETGMLLFPHQWLLDAKNWFDTQQ